MTPTVALVWYLVVSGPQGGLTTMPGYFDTREECAASITEYQKVPAAGWSASCVPSTSPYGDDGDTGADDQSAQ